MPRKPRITDKLLSEICRRLMNGESLTQMCNDKHLPSWRTVLRHVQDSNEAHTQYRRARAIQAEVMRDLIIDLVTAPLPDDAKLAQAEVNRRRLEADYRDKLIRQLQPLGLRGRSEDVAPATSLNGGGAVVIQWQGGATLPALEQAAIDVTPDDER